MPLGDNMLTSKSKYPISKVSLALMTALAIPTMAAETNQEQGDENALEVIMVTAQKRVQNVKEVPISMTAIGQEKLAEANINNSEELSSYIANFSINETGQGFNVIMRGLGSGPNQGFEQTVGTFVDGVYRGRGNLMRSAFLDLERVEVLRGPQSALFGKNTTAGALNLTNAKPTEDFEAYINTTYDFTFNTATVETAVSNSLSDNVQARVAIKYVDGGGFVENTVTGNDEVEHQTLLGRLTLAWQPTDDVNVMLTAQHDKDDLTGYNTNQVFVEPAISSSDDPRVIGTLNAIKDYVIDDKSHKTNLALGEVEQGTFDANHLTLNVEYDMGHSTITSITGWQSYELNGSNDGDNSAIPLVYRPLNNEKFDQLSQELRITSAFDGDFNYIAGVYYQTTNLEFDEEQLVYPLNIIGERDFNVDSDTAAIFGQFDYSFSERWQASLGLRYSSETKDGYRKILTVDPTTRTPIAEKPLHEAPAIRKIAPNGMPGQMFVNRVLASQNIYNHEVSNSKTENSFTPSLNLKYKMDNAMIYGSIATGTKAGGFDARANNPDDFEFEDEKVLSYELGTKFTLDDGLADINIALFNMVFEDLQTSIYDGSTGFFVQNGGKATSMGIELDGRWAFADNWLISGSLGLLDFKWDEFTGTKCFSSVSLTPDNLEPGGESCDNSGKTNAYSPKVSGSVNLEYYMELTDSIELKTSLDIIHKSEYYTNADLNPFTKQDAFTKFNARISFLSTDGSWQVALLAKNITDETTLNQSSDMPLIGAGFYNVKTDPGRSVSMQFSYMFE